MTRSQAQTGPICCSAVRATTRWQVAAAVTASGGSGNDTLTGGGSSETFLGGSGNDTINPGGGTDVVFGEEGDDHVNIRDRTADVAFGGAGNDTVIADPGNLDVIDGFETI